MTPERIKLIHYRLDRAQESLEEARLLLETGHFNGCTNRLYYACFYVVSALLLTEGKSSSKHSGVRALFDREWVNRDRVSVEIGRFYRSMFNMRQKSDYDDLVQFQEKEVHKQFEQTREVVGKLVQKVEDILRADKKENGLSREKNADTET